MDKLIVRLIQKAKKNKLLAMPALLAVFVLIFWKHLKEMFIRIGKMNRTKRLIAAAIASMLVLSLLGPLKGLFRIMNVNAEAVEWDGVTVDTSWYDNSVIAKEYQITTAEGLAGLSELVNGGVSFYGKTIVASFDTINMNLHEFTPIGTPENPFLGEFRAAGENGALTVTRFYSPQPGQGIFGTIHSNYINSVSGISFRVDSFTGVVDDSGTDYATGAFVGDDGILYLPLTDTNDNHDVVKYKVTAAVIPDNAWCTDVQYRIINSNDGIECTPDGIITVHNEGTFEILAEALDPFTYGQDTREAVIEVKVLERTKFRQNPFWVDHEYGVDTDFGDISGYMEVNYPERLHYEVLQDYNVAGVYVDANNHLHATGVGTSVITVKGLFTNESRRITLTVEPTLKAITLNADKDTVVPGEKITFQTSMDYGELPPNAYQAAIPMLRVEGLSDYRLDGMELYVPKYATENEFTVFAQYTNPYSKNTIKSDAFTVTLKQEEGTTAGGVVNPPEASSAAGTEGTTENSTEGTSENTTEGTSEGETENMTEKNTEGTSENETEKNTEGTSENETEKNTEGTSENETEKNTEGTSENETEKNTEDTSENETEKNTEGTSENETEKNTEGTSENETEKNTEGTSENETGNSTEDMTEKAEESPAETEPENDTEEAIEQDSKKSTQVQSDLGTSESGGYSGTIPDIYYVRYSRITGNVEDGYSVALSAKYNGDELVSLEEADCYEASSFDENGKGTFTYYVRTGNEVSLSVNLDDATYQWDKTAYTVENGMFKTMDVQEMTEGTAYGIRIPVAAEGGDRSIMIMNVSCADASINKVYVDDVEYDLMPVEDKEDHYYVNMPFGTLPESNSLLRFNAHNTAQVVMSDVNTEEGGVYLNVTVIPVDVAIASRAYTIHFVEQPNTQADITGIIIGGETIDFVPDAENWSAEEIASGNLYKAVFTGSISKDISLNVSPYAEYTIENIEIDAANGKIVFKANVTAQDGVTIRRHTVMLKNNGTLDGIIVAPGDITYTQEELNDIVLNLMEITYTISQEDVPDNSLDAVRRKADILVRQSLAGKLTDGLELMLTDLAYIEAQKGTAQNTEGSSGKYTYSVVVKCGDVSSAAIGMSMNILPKEYVLPEIDYVTAENGKVTVVLRSNPTDLPELQLFTGSIRVNGGLLSYYSMYNSSAVYDEKTCTITYYPPMLAKTDKEQSVVVYVNYNGGYASAAPAYIIPAMGQCATPVASVAAGSYDKKLSVELYTATPGATIYYTTDGSQPTKESSVYRGPIEVLGGLYGNGRTTMIRAFAAMNDMVNSSEMLNSYTITIPYGTHVSGVEVVSENMPSVVVSGLEDLFNDPAVYTSADKALVAAGGSVTLWLRIGEKDFNTLISGGGQNALDANRMSSYCDENKYTISSIYDAELVKRVTDTSGNSTISTVGEMSSGKLSISITLTEEQQKNNALRLLRAHNMSIDPLSDVDSSSMTYTFETDKLSLFALVYGSKTFHPIFNTGGGSSSGSGDSTGGSTQDGQQTQTAAPTQPQPTSGVASGSNHSVIDGNGSRPITGQSNQAATSSPVTNNNQSATGAAKTGDSAPIAILAIVLLLSAGAMIAVFVTGRKKDKK